MTHRTTDERDLTAVREVIAARLAGTDQSLARSRAAVAARRDMPRAGKFRRHLPVQWLVPAGAAAAAIVVLLGIVTVIGPGRDDTDLQPAAPTGPGSPDPGPLPGPEAVAILYDLALAAEQGEPAPVEDGQLVYTRTEGWFGRTGLPHEDHQLWEEWFDRDGPVRIIHNGQISLEVSDSKDNPYPVPTGEFYTPTQEWLGELPSDPEALLAELRADFSPEGGYSAEYELWYAIGENLYRSGEVLIPPALRAALLRAYAGLPGLSVRQADVEGWKLYAFGIIERGTAREVLFDPETGRAVGLRGLVAADEPGDNLVQPPDASTLGLGVDNLVLWTQAIVDEVGETG